MTINWGRIHRRIQRILPLFVLLFSSIAYSCTKSTSPYFEGLDILNEVYVDTILVIRPPYREWNNESVINVNRFGSLRFTHQSAAAYKDYAFFVTEGRSKVCLYSLKKKQIIYTLSLKSFNGDIYHCNQSTFGIEKYEQDDYFPLLYVSQRAKSDGRCFIEAFRVFPLYNEDLSEFESFYLELVQTVYLPKMTSLNSMGNANCVIDASTKTMYTYSRNNNKIDENYGQCKISQFSIPDMRQKTVILQDEDISSSFMIDASAINMQGGCIHDRVLYIGQGFPSAGYIYLNIIDLDKKELVRRIDLQEYNVSWEPEGCFFYDGCVMLAHSWEICKIDKE